MYEINIKMVACGPLLHVAMVFIYDKELFIVGLTFGNIVLCSNNLLF